MFSIFVACGGAPADPRASLGAAARSPLALAIGRLRSSLRVCCAGAARQGALPLLVLPSASCCAPLVTAQVRRGRAMTESPLSASVVFHLGPVPITTAGRGDLGHHGAARRRVVAPDTPPVAAPAGAQAALELVVDASTGQIRDTMRADPAPYLPLIGTLFLFILAANWSSLVPGIEPPTAHIETDAALALIVFVAIDLVRHPRARRAPAGWRASPSRTCS